MGDAPTTYYPTDPDLLDCGPATGEVVSHPIVGKPQAPAADPLTERSRRVWRAGDYDRISQGFRHEAEAFVARLGLKPADRVLDAACGSGNLTIPAARTGARVTGLDLVPELLAQASAWAGREGLPIRLDQGTVEELPYEAAAFDMVVSMFGLMFAARPERVVAELARVTRPGGWVVLANWTREGFVGRMLAAHVKHVAPPAGSQSPLLWGEPKVILERFDARLWNVSVTPRTLTFRYPHTPAGTAELFRTAYGPTVRAFEALDEDGRASLAASLTALWIEGQRPGARQTAVESEYLEVVAVRK
jgi:ubiquinone/menaquinone biosynthesis C-methylase UbiE